VLPQTVTVTAGDRIQFAFSWTHPERWRNLSDLHLRIVDDTQLLLWTRFNVQGNVLSLIGGDKPHGPQAGTPGSHGFLQNTNVWVDLKDSAGIANGPDDPRADFFHTCALLAEGTTRCWGNNSFGQLGNNSTTNSSLPVTVIGLAGTITGQWTRNVTITPEP